MPFYTVIFSRYNDHTRGLEGLEGLEDSAALIFGVLH